MSLKDKLIKNSKIKETSLIMESKIWSVKETLITRIPALNLALSGDLYGGMVPGVLQIAGKSRRFKSKFALEIADTFIKKFSEGVVLIYDSEFGMPKSYYNGMTTENIIHSPITTVEQLKFDMASQLKLVDPDSKDKLLVVVDSLGNLPSTKEMEDAEKGNDVTDMTRAKGIRSYFRVIGATLNIKEVYLIVINHTYDPTVGMSKAEIVGGGGGPVYNANGIWIIGVNTEKDKDGTTTGFQFNININKSRFVRQNMKIPVEVTFEEGIKKWSGMLDLAVESGHVIRPNAQRYALATKPEETFYRKDIEDNDAFMETLMKTDFPLWCKNTFQYKD